MTVTSFYCLYHRTMRGFESHSSFRTVTQLVERRKFTVPLSPILCMWLYLILIITSGSADCGYFEIRTANSLRTVRLRPSVRVLRKHRSRLFSGCDNILPLIITYSSADDSYFGLLILRSRVRIPSGPPWLGSSVGRADNVLLSPILCMWLYLPGFGSAFSLSIQTWEECCHVKIQF